MSQLDLSAIKSSCKKDPEMQLSNIYFQYALIDHTHDFLFRFWHDIFAYCQVCVACRDARLAFRYAYLECGLPPVNHSRDAVQNMICVVPLFCLYCSFTSQPLNPNLSF